MFFRVTSDGYINAFNLPGSPDAGVLLATRAGGQATVYLNRTQPAERLYRLTGGGLYRDTILVGGAAPVKEPLLSSAGVLGQDSLVAVAFGNRSFWLFGDTECPAGPRSTDCQHYGMFTTGATAPLMGPGGGAGREPGRAGGRDAAVAAVLYLLRPPRAGRHGKERPARPGDDRSVE